MTTTLKKSIADKLQAGGDLRSIGQVNDIIENINNQAKFDELFKCLFHKERIIVMQTADAIEKITIHNPLFLKKHKKRILGLCDIAYDKELKWHLALLIPRLELSEEELGKAWNALTMWATNKTNSRIVRVNSVQGLFELLKKEGKRKQEYELTLLGLEKENIPSLNARIKRIKKQLLSDA